MNVKGIKCPICKKKTLSHLTNPRWNNWLEYDKAYCRSCKSKFKEKSQ